MDLSTPRLRWLLREGARRGLHLRGAELEGVLARLADVGAVQNDRGAVLATARDLEFGRIVVSEVEVPNMLAIPV
jgi:hypothetical protein